MAQVIIEVNERSYTMQCGVGQEEHVRRLARMVDLEVAKLRESAGPVGDIRLLLMAALVLADRIVELNEKLETVQEELARARADDSDKMAAAILQSVESATRRLERLTGDAGDQATPRKPSGGS